MAKNNFKVLPVFSDKSNMMEAHLMPLKLPDENQETTSTLLSSWPMMLPSTCTTLSTNPIQVLGLLSKPEFIKGEWTRKQTF